MIEEHSEPRKTEGGPDARVEELGEERFTPLFINVRYLGLETEV